MKTRAFAIRNCREMLRDRLNLLFGLGFPVALLLLLTLIQSSIPVDLFRMERLAPGVAVFGLSFLSLFSATLISRDRASSLMLRLLASPLSAAGFILGYFLPLLPMAVGQVAVCYLTAFLLGLPMTAHVLVAILTAIPAAMVFIALGLLFGSLLNDRQVGGICGALLTNLSAWLSGTWFDVKLVGGVFEKIASLLPFLHAVDAGRAALAGNYAAIFPSLFLVIGYAVALMGLAILAFTRRMRPD